MPLVWSAPRLHAQVWPLPNLLPGTGSEGADRRGQEIELVGTGMVSDPIADMLTRIRNANMVRQEFVLIPWSKVKLAVARVLKEEGFIGSYEVLKGRPGRVLKLYLKYYDKSQPLLSGLKRVSKPGLRVYVGRSEIPRVYGGLGIAIVSTSKGILTGQQAWKQGVGGELLCYIW